MSRFTEDPEFTDVPAAGLELITLPEATVLLGAVVTVPTTNPDRVITVEAALCVVPTALGTATLTAPVETTKLTEDPVVTDVPAAGFELITLPEATVLLDAVVIVPTTNPAPLIAVDAALCANPITFGTATAAGPVETTRFTEDPAFTEAPAAGFELITLPVATVLLDAEVTVPTTNPAPVIAVDAAL
jgi:hypothetical protein